MRRRKPHPISGENLDKALQENEDREISREVVNDALVDFQDLLEKNLAEELRYYHEEGPREKLNEVIPGDGWYVNTYNYILFEEFSYNPYDVLYREFENKNESLATNEEVQDIVLSSHDIQFRELVEKRGLTSRATGKPAVPGQYPAVVQKPYIWIGAENSRNREYSLFLEAGLSPAELLDYLMVEEGEATTSSWAKTRQCSAQAISQNIKRARNKLDEHFE